MKIEPARLQFDPGFDGYCSAKPFGGERKRERAVDHNWVTVSNGENVYQLGAVFCVYCGAFAWHRSVVEKSLRKAG